MLPSVQSLLSRLRNPHWRAGSPKGLCEPQRCVLLEEGPQSRTGALSPEEGEVGSRGQESGRSTKPWSPQRGCTLESWGEMENADGTATHASLGPCVALGVWSLQFPQVF